MSTAAQAEYNSIYNSAIPGANVHPEDSCSLESHSDTSLEHDGSNTLHSSDERSLAPSEPSTAMPHATYIPNTQFDANTGPKGVIADARSFETARKRSFRQTLYDIAGSTPSRKLSPTNREKTNSPSPDISADEEDDKFMRQWRQKRLDELSTMKQEIRTRRQSPSKRRYGSLVTVDPAGYLDAVEKVGHETIVVVFIYHDGYDMSDKVEDALKVLARKHVTTRFIKLHYLEAEMDEIAAPGVVAYRAGDCFANLVSFLSEIPTGKDVNTTTVEEVLERHRVLV